MFSECQGPKTKFLQITKWKYDYIKKIVVVENLQFSKDHK